MRVKDCMCKNIVTASSDTTLEQIAKDIYNECKAEGEEVTMEEALEMAKMENDLKTKLLQIRSGN